MPEPISGFEQRGQITEDDFRATSNLIALALIEGRTFDLTKNGGVTPTSKLSNGYTVEQAEDVALHIINTLIAAKEKRQPEKLSKLIGQSLGAQLKRDYRPEIERLASVLLHGPVEDDDDPQAFTEYNEDLCSALDSITYLTNFPVHFVDDENIAREFTLVNSALNSTDLRTQRELDILAAFKEKLVRDKSRFTSAKNFLTLPTGNWVNASKAQLTSAFRENEVNAFINKISRFLEDQRGHAIDRFCNGDVEFAKQDGIPVRIVNEDQRTIAARIRAKSDISTPVHHSPVQRAPKQRVPETPLPESPIPEAARPRIPTPVEERPPVKFTRQVPAVLRPKAQTPVVEQSLAAQKAALARGLGAEFVPADARPVPVRQKQTTPPVSSTPPKLTEQQKRAAKEREALSLLSTTGIVLPKRERPPQYSMNDPLGGYDVIPPAQTAFQAVTPAPHPSTPIPSAFLDDDAEFEEITAEEYDTVRHFPSKPSVEGANTDYSVLNRTDSIDDDSRTVTPTSSIHSNESDLIDNGAYERLNHSHPAPQSPGTDSLGSEATYVSVHNNDN